MESAAQIPDHELERWERETGEHRDNYPLDPDEYHAAVHSAATPPNHDHRLVLEIEVPGFYVEGNEAELAEEWGGTLLDVVTDEWMRSDVGLTLVSLPGEKNLNSDFEVHAMNGRIVGARIVGA